MADAAASSGSPGGLTIPADLQAKYPALIDLILHSESMNDEERQYWINILPIMTPEQIQNLYGILENERKQLAAIDEKYARETQKLSTASPAETGETLRRQREERRKGESENRTEEEKAADALLKKIEGS